MLRVKSKLKTEVNLTLKSTLLTYFGVILTLKLTLFEVNLLLKLTLFEVNL